MSNTALNSGVGVTRWINASVENIPIPQTPSVEQRPFIHLIDHVLTAKSADPAADTDEQEAEIDWLVYGLYGLTEEEIGAVEES